MYWPRRLRAFLSARIVWSAATGERDMGNGRSIFAARHLRWLFERGTANGLTDCELLERVVPGAGDREAAEAAFHVLVERHGPMVLRVCRCALGDADDAEDAFQATFLTL